MQDTAWLDCRFSSKYGVLVPFSPEYGLLVPVGDSGIITPVMTQADPHDPAAAKDGDSAPRVAGPLSIPAISYRRPRS